IANWIWSGIDVAGFALAALGAAFAFRIAWRSEPRPLSFVFVTRYGSCTGLVVTATNPQKADVSPVVRLVAVGLRCVRRGTRRATEPRIVATPAALVKTVTEPSGVAPAPLVAPVAPGFAKNWIRKLVLGVDCKVPLMIVPTLAG